MESLSSIGSQTTRFCLISLFLFYHLPCALSQPDSTFCETLYHCGNITAGFPFSGENRQEDCGHPSLKLNCNKGSNTTSLFISGHNYTVLHIDKNILRLSRQDFSGSFCSASFSSTPFPPDLFQNLPSYKSLTVLYVCDSRHHFFGNFTCLVKGLGSVVQNSMYHKHCDKSFDVTVPTSFVQNEEALDLTHFESVLRNGFEVELKIYERSGEQCLFAGTENAGLYQISKQFCCKNVSGSGMNCLTIRDKSVTKVEELVTLIIFGTVAGSVLVLYVVAFAFLLWDRIRENALRDENLDALVTLRRYSYGKIKKITKSFTEVVGQGGFGTVYKGKLHDGSKVAVKVLKDSKRNCEDFINEVASMSQTSHVNIVSLLGFCYEGSKRAIVYEFLENGSLDQFISKSGDLSVSTLYEIALGVARGIEYLHYGCKTRIVHFDIKPQNVLLDDNLRPKVSDFGLAKLCENQESILSLLDMRGTIGYIAPEVFSRMYGSVSHKSDVYSYGMLVLEMIGARNKERGENANSNNSSAYFPGWIYKDLENGDNARLLGSDELTREEEEIAKKMILVSLWCIQQCPSDRPSMNKVVEMMEGSLDSLQAPPKPLLHMPMQNVSESSQPSEEISILSEVYNSMNVGDL